MQLKEIKPHSFIYAADDALSESVCSDMIRRFEAAADEHYRGHVGQTVSTDL